MRFINLANIEKELLDFAIAKHDFENLWISKGVIQDRLTISDFISCIDIENNILCITEKNLYVPFKYMLSENDEYIFHVGEINDYEKSILEKNKYFDNLKKIDQTQMVANNLEKPLGDFYFIIDKEMYQ